MDKYLLFFYILQASINLFVCIFLALKSFETKLRYGVKTTTILAILYTITSIFIIELFIEVNAPFIKYHGIVTIIWALITLTFAIVALRSNITQLMFFIFAIINLQLNVMLISRAIYASNLVPATEINHLIISIIVLILMIPLMWYLFAHLFKKVVDLEIPTIYWRPLYLLPFTYFIFYWCIINLYAAPVGGNPEKNIFILLFLNIFSYLSCVAVLQLLISTFESLKATEKANISQKIIMMQKEQYREIAQHIEKTNSLHHDFRHHLIAIKSFADSDNLADLQKYLDPFQKETMDTYNARVCDNQAVDAVICYYRNQAQDANIEINVTAVSLTDFKIADTDLCLVFGNLLENSLESCKRQQNGKKFIDLKTKNISKSMLAITLSNSYDDEIRQKGNDFLSNKHEAVGIGTATIREIATRNNGSCHFSFTDGIFKAEIILIT